MEKALRLAMKDSVRIWLVDQIDTWARRAEVRLASDLAGGMSGSFLWPFTLRVEGPPGREAGLGRRPAS
jgi:peptide/nickel transport system substrate-binding protein